MEYNLARNMYSLRLDHSYINLYRSGEIFGTFCHNYSIRWNTRESFHVNKRTAYRILKHNDFTYKE